MSDNVKVAVRVRPFNSREKGRSARNVIKMVGNTTTIEDPENPENIKTFNYDYSYWSHDQFTEGPDGYLNPAPGSIYADQKRVFEELGRGVLANAWAGYNCSLFAYGQTGSGKSYSMVGYGSNKGIVPVSCEELFKAINSGDGSIVCEVTYSMMEIYNEAAQDLLGSHVKGGMKIRESPSKGFYVDGLTVMPVQSFKEIEDYMEKGTRNRTIAATNMNATSSRAHTIVTINFSQKSQNAQGQSMTKTSNINLVDLAGSERADSTGATGDRLKEGAGINQSLSALGNVISALVDAQADPKKMVPYRNSTLTKLLKNALGGNSKTIMIAALSPADINYDETLSTLRFADRVKSIKTSAVVNESPTDKLIRELREENARLQAMLSGGTLSLPVLGGSANATDEEIQRKRAEAEEELRRMMEENKRAMEEQEKSFRQKLQEQAAAKRKEQEETDLQKERRRHEPHFWNMNEDPTLAGVLCHFVSAGETTIGQRGTIALKGLNILEQHAVVTVDGDSIVIKKAVPEAKILVNGSVVKDKPVVLHHHARVMFGSSSLFCFTHPRESEAAAQEGKSLPIPTYEDAQQEIAEKSGLTIRRAGLSKEDLLLQEDLVSLMPHVNEANAIAETLNAKRSFEILLMSAAARGLKEGPTQVMVKMVDLTTDHFWLWTRNTFMDRKYGMQGVYQNFIAGEAWEVEQDQDPFYEPYDKEVHIASAHLYLQFIAYLIDMKDVLVLTNFRGIEQGHLEVSMVPCTPAGKDLSDSLEDIFVENPSDLLGKRVDYLLKIKCVRGLPPKFTKGVHCRYRFYDDREGVDTDKIDSASPRFEHVRQLTINPVTKEFLDYVASSSLVIELHGQQATAVKGGTQMSTFARAATGLGLMGQDEEVARLRAEALLNTRRLQRMSSRLKKVVQLLEIHKHDRNVPYQDLQLAVSPSNARFRAAARTVILGNKVQEWRNSSTGDRREMSQACCIQ